MINYIILFNLSVLVSVLSQVLLKSSAISKKENIVKEYINLKVICAYSMFFLCTIFAVICYRYIPLSWGAVFESLAYIYIPIISYFIFNEKISSKKILGMGLIIVGMIVFVV